jgi:hypothetical protein
MGSSTNQVSSAPLQPQRRPNSSLQLPRFKQDGSLNEIASEGYQHRWSDDT